MSFFKRLRERVARDPRLVRIVHGGFSSAASRVVAVGVSAISLPLTVRYLGKLEYGIWITISSSIVMLAVLDLGIANSLTNFISKAYADKDEVLAQRYFASAFWCSAGIALVLGLVGMVAMRWIDWAALFRLTDLGLAAQARTCVAICFTFFLVGLPLNLANKVLGGYQEVHLSNYFAMGNSVFGLLAMLFTIFLHGGLVMLAASFCTTSLLGSAGMNLWLVVHHRPGLLPVFSAVKKDLSRELFSGGGLFFVLQLCGLIVFNSDNIVIAHYLGADEVTPYSVAWRLCAYASLLQGMLVPSIWPAFAESYHRGDLAWIRSTYRHIMRGSMLAVGGAAVLIGLFGQWFIRVWAGHAAVPSHALLWTMGFWVLLLSYTVNQAMLLAATQRIQLQAISSVLAAIVNLVLSIVFVQRMGAIGVLFATILSYLMFILAPQAWEERRILRGRYLQVAE